MQGQTSLCASVTSVAACVHCCLQRRSAARRLTCEVGHVDNFAGDSRTVSLAEHSTAKRSAWGPEKQVQAFNRSSLQTH